MTRNASIEQTDDSTVSIRGEMTFSSTPALFDQARALFPGDGAISCVDLADVTTADSAGLALLLEWQALNRTSGAELRICNAPSSLVSLARLCEAGELLRLSGRKQ